MRNALLMLFIISLVATQAYADENTWYTGDQHCPPPKDDGQYSAPYAAQNHAHDFPTFPDADKPGWSCSYQREDGIIVQFGDSRTPVQQWIAIWGGDSEE